MKTFITIKDFLLRNKTESFLLILLLVISGFLRFSGLGYSDYYGDEAKTLYWNKTQPAADFLLNQRKGPVQFLASWTMEKVSGGFEEGVIRAPFALAGFLVVPVLYALLRRRYGKEVAFVGAFLFSTNGFFIAFSRIAQYQSFLILFGLLTLLLLDLYIQSKKNIHLVLAGLTLGIAFLAHYDAVFFLFPSIYILWKEFGKEVLPKFIVPMLVVLVPFYLPYVLGGYFMEHTSGYIARRLVKEVATSSAFTYILYNPFILGLVPFSFFIFSIRVKRDNFVKAVWVWLFISFVFFEFVVSSAGTHIQNYILPLIILSSIGLVRVIKEIGHKVIKGAMSVLIVILFVGILVKQATAFVPVFSLGYPWNETKIAETENQRFIYGFPYKRGWDQIENYLRENGARSFYTTDNVTIGEFYLRGIPADKSNPHYFVHVYNNQEFHMLSDVPERLEYRDIVLKKDAVEFLDLKETIRVYGEITALIYKRVD